MVLGWGRNISGMGWGVDSTVSKCRVRGVWLCRNQETLFFQIGDTFCSFTGAEPDPNTPHHSLRSIPGPDFSLSSIPEPLPAVPSP